MLLENDKLIFRREDLMNNDFHSRIAGVQVRKKYLNLEFEKKVVIIRVIDSKKENFKLGKSYKDRFNEIYTCRTCPEIEYLLIMFHHDERQLL